MTPATWSNPAISPSRLDQRFCSECQKTLNFDPATLKHVWILTLSMFLLYIYHISQSFVIVKLYLILQLLPWVAEIDEILFGVGNRNFLLSGPAN